MIKLVALDLDGTLVGRDLTVRPRVREEIVRVRDAGVAGCVVTGRMYRAALPYARQLDLTAPLICYQGAAIIDPESDDVLFDVPVENDVVLDLAATAKRDGMHVQLYRNDNYYCEQRNRFSGLYARLSNVEPIVVPNLEEAFAASDATKGVVIADADDAAAYAPRLAEHLMGRAYVTRSYPEFIEVLNPHVDKGEALRFVAARLGIELSDVLAIGDSWNDEPLLHAAGVAVAMGSAPESLLKLADAVVADVENDGVAEALRRYIPG